MSAAEYPPHPGEGLRADLAAKFHAAGLKGWVIDPERNVIAATTDEPLPTSALKGLEKRGSGSITEGVAEPLAWAATGRRRAEAYLIAPVPEGQDPSALAAVLGVLANEVAERGRAERILEGFASQLSQSYENTALLYTLGRLLDGSTEPEEFIDLTLERIARVSPFKHIGVRLLPDVAETRGLENLKPGDRFFTGGNLPGPLDTLVPWIDHPAETLIHDDGTHEAITSRFAADKSVVGVLVIACKTGEDSRVSSYDTQLVEAIAGFLSAQLSSRRLHAEQEAAFLGTVRAMTRGLDAKDRYTAGHSERVALLAKQLAIAAGLDEHTVERVHLCGLLHDIGKIGVPEAVLCKPGRLTEEEFEQIKRHPDIGAEMLAGLVAMSDLVPGVRHHHEKWNGRGYPDGLAGEDIPLFGRILALADTFDAMSSNRSYRNARPREEVLAEVERCAGTQFDPSLAPLFITLDFAPFDELMAEHKRTASDVQTVIRSDAA
ncbi:MAG: HD-GYP domain-containing protein [Planctomycetota bacterium]